MQDRSLTALISILSGTYDFEHAVECYFRLVYGDGDQGKGGYGGKERACDSEDSHQLPCGHPAMEYRHGAVCDKPCHDQNACDA